MPPGPRLSTCPSANIHVGTSHGLRVPIIPRADRHDKKATSSRLRPHDGCPNGGRPVEWRFAHERWRSLQFIQRFLNPTCPVRGSRRQRKDEGDKGRAAEFDSHQRQVIRKLGEISTARGGNLVVTRETRGRFFRRQPTSTM